MPSATGIERWLLYLIAGLVFAASFGIAYLVRHFLFAYLRRRAAASPTATDDTIVDAVRGPFVLWCACAGFYAASRVAPLPLEFLKVSDKVLVALVIGSVTWTAAQVAIILIRNRSTRAEATAAYVGLTQTIVRMLIVVVGGLMLLNALGVSITPLITALGIGGLAVALALQDTLANIFAGIYTTLSRQIRPGDYIRLESGFEGVVVDITWRATTIRTIRNNIVIIPNAKLAQSVVTNFHLREPFFRLDIPIGVSYSSDPEHVERVLLEEVRSAFGSVDNLLAEPEPFVLFMPGFGDFSLNFTLVVYVRTFTDQFQVQHLLRKRIFKRFRAEGIEIPFPIRTVYLRGDSRTGTAVAGRNRPK